MRRLPLHVWILLALVAGAGVGVGLNLWWTPGVWRSLGVGDSAAFLSRANSEANADARPIAHVARLAVRVAQFVGDLFLQSLRFVAVPVVLFSLIVGVASLGDPRKLGRIGGRTIGLFAATTLVAAGIGLALSNAVGPGRFVPTETRDALAATQQAGAAQRIAAGERVRAETSVWQEIVNVIPANPFAAIAQGQMLQIVATACVIGIGLTLLPRQKAAPVVAVCDGLQEAIIRIIRLVMLAAPLAVFCLIARTVSMLGLDVLGALVVYCAVVLAGLGVVLVGLYPAMTWALTPAGNRVGIGRFFRAMAPAQLLAFSSSSSAATLPVTMQCARERLGVSEQIASFVVPLGATTNMAGTALYQAVASTFIAQLFGIELTLVQQATIVFLATVIAIGSPGVPGGSIVMMVIVLEAIGVPPQGIAVILAVDRVLDMARTVVNVSGDAAVAAVVAAGEGQLAAAGPEGLSRGADAELTPPGG